MKAVVFTLGCKVNECESDSLIQGLISRGYEVYDKLVYADLYIVNTCAVTQEAEKKSRQTASRIKKLNPNAKIIFTGCACEKNAKPFAEKSPSYLVTGVFDKGKILDMLDNAGVNIAPQNQVYEELLPVKSLRTRTYVKVQDGCNNFCTYCIIPYLRGRSRSRAPQSIVDEITAIKPKEAIINGINLSAYNYEGTGLTGLILALKDVDCRIRLGSLEVNVITEEFLTALKGLKDFAPHFHLSLQAGSNAVLKSMNRHYTREQFIEKVNLIRKYFENAGITTDIIAGFPTETEEDFLQSISLAKEVKFSDIHPFSFSARQGTVAYKMQDLPPQVKKDRLNRLLEVKAELKNKFIKDRLNTTEFFLPEETVNGYTEGYTGNYIRVYVKDFNGDKKLTKVRLIAPYGDGAIAEVVKD
ncbi:MAG: tRNA (N(6)-L-threonylcarbamoyladenosine(37)-C(2))-methylthiotransferase MtaB [Clostridia bacterium]|nr:tRNA (N(6)-L-threonylcarbamoyladenosine(37)-C(2))-methylthiotransferase MtaB [Clostridia bacterium]